jgi:hypothetical protein
VHAKQLRTPQQHVGEKNFFGNACTHENRVMEKSPVRTYIRMYNPTDKTAHRAHYVPMARDTLARVSEIELRPSRKYSLARIISTVSAEASGHHLRFPQQSPTPQKQLDSSKYSSRGRGTFDELFFIPPFSPLTQLLLQIPGCTENFCSNACASASATRLQQERYACNRTK